jgi:AcrR family transcriptional regulator
MEGNEMTEKKRVRRDRREEILREATRLFSTYGFRGTSLSSVAEAVELTEPGLLHYFPSKVKLLQGVLEYREQEDEKKYLGMVDRENVDLAGVMEALEILVSENERVPELIRLFTVLVGESIREGHPSHDFFVNRYAHVRQQFAQVLAHLSETGQLEPDRDLDRLGPIIIAVMDGLQIQWLLDPENVGMSESFELFTKMIVDYFADSTRPC